MTLHYLDCRAAGSKEDPVRIIAEYDSQEDCITVSGILPYQPSKNPFKDKPPEIVEMMKQIMKNTVIVVDNGAAFRKWDICFSQVEHLDAAVKAYYALKAMHAIKIEPDVLSTYNLDSVIEIRKMGLTGNVYELNSDEVANGHIVILMICWASLKMRGGLRLISEDHSPTQEDEDAFNVPFCL